MKKLNLGCGPKPIEGWVNLESTKLPGVDVVWDVNKRPLPFKDNTFAEVEAIFILEHVDDLIGTMEELHRICANGAKLNIRVPSFSNPFFWDDPTHVRPFNYNSFNYFTSTSAFPYLSNARFVILKRRIFYLQAASFFKSRWFVAPLDGMINLKPAFYEKFFGYILPSSELHFLLGVEK
jgi:SAM-dependent methyltransferase